MDMIITILAISAVSTAVACIPVISALEDFYVNGLYYHHNPLFTGSVTKSNHFEIILSYYGVWILQKH